MHYCGSESSGSRSISIWAGRCDCGELVPVWSNALQSGKTQSCGCLSRDASSERNSKALIGQTFGRLVVRSRVPGHHGSARWLCSCGCGGTTEVRTVNLQNAIAGERRRERVCENVINH